MNFLWGLLAAVLIAFFSAPSLAQEDTARLRHDSGSALRQIREARLRRFGKRGYARFGKRGYARFGKRGYARFGKRGYARFGKRGYARFGKRATPDSGSAATPDSGSAATPDSGSAATPDSGSAATPDSEARLRQRGYARFGKRGYARFGKRGYTTFGKRGYARFGKRGYARFGKRGYARFGKRSAIINTQHCVAASVNLMRTAEQQLPGLVFVQEPWMTKGKPNNVVDDLASSLGGAITTAFEAACPLKAYKGKKSAPWWNPELGALRRRARTLQRRALKTKDPSDREAYTRAIHEFKGQVRRAKTAKWRQYCEGLEGSRPVARVVKALTNDRFSKLSVVKRPDGSVTESSEETLELMLNSFFPKSPTQQGPPDHTGFLGRAERWADQCGLRLSESKTTAVMFTNKLLWTIKPLTLYGKNISMEKQVRCLGLTLDHRLNWTPHIQTKAKKALAVLAQIRRAVGTTWGLTPRKLWWIYTAIIRPSISYASLVWASGLSVKSNLDALYKIQGRACRMTMGAPPSTPFEGMNAFLCAPPLDIYIKGEAAKSTRRLLDAGVAFKKVRAFKKRSLIPHSDLCLKALEECGGLNILTDSIPATLLLSQRYKVTIQPRHEASDSWSDSEVHCYTDGSMRHGLSGFGACVFFKGEVVWSYSQHTGLNSSVFQSEVLAISSCAAELRRRQLSGRKFIFHSDSQAALRALCRSTASSRSVLDCNTQLNGLALGNQVELRWIPGHAGFLGNERADLLAKAGSAGALLGPGPGAPIPASVINSRVKRWADSEHLRRWHDTR
uniref:RNase H domain-containing protein n=1 Tax=Macrostomum lignano TaxID=282301 RepID=A0A1I8IXZ7_9PLAT